MVVLFMMLGIAALSFWVGAQCGLHDGEEKGYLHGVDDAVDVLADAVSSNDPRTDFDKAHMRLEKSVYSAIAKRREEENA